MPKIGYVLVGFAYSVVFGCVIAAFTGVEKVERYDCPWRLTGNRVEVDLGVSGGFSWSPVVSDKLIEHLTKDEPAKVRVDVPIIRDFGRIRARGMIQAVDGIAVREPDGSSFDLALTERGAPVIGSPTSVWVRGKSESRDLTCGNRRGKRSWKPRARPPSQR